MRRADIVVAAVGGSRIAPGGWIKPGATVIDVGIKRIEACSKDDESARYKLLGDVDSHSAAKVASSITPQCQAASVP